VTAPADVAVLVLHEVGDAGGERWRVALEDAGWPGPVLAPDLPGHGGEPPPVGGSYEPMDGAYVAVRTPGGLPPSGPGPVVVGLGTSGWAAHVLALGGRASALVLVDGLGGPWTDPRTAIRAGRDWLRAIAADAAAVATPPPGQRDPRTAHGVPAHGSRRLVERAAAATPVPALVVESRRSPVDFGDAEALAASFAAGAQAVRVAEPDPAAVAAIVVAWAARTVLPGPAVPGAPAPSPGMSNRPG